uniref:Reverse transcriptase domain-containing protein n=1 Tax=Amphimedon queenslandica TaxID=400682 RepID=A0A1X7U9N4_AMPQE
FLPDDASVLFSLQTPAQTLDSIEISIEDVLSALVSLNPSKATGIDGIPAHLLKSCATPLCEPIHHLFVQCFAQSYLPLEWRTHLITPIHKSGNKSSVTNYRPISLLCCISKVLEKIIFDKIADFIQPHFVSPRQFGFLKNRPTPTIGGLSLSNRSI